MELRHRYENVNPLDFWSAKEKKRSGTSDSEPKNLFRLAMWNAPAQNEDVQRLSIELFLSSQNGGAYSAKFFGT